MPTEAAVRTEITMPPPPAQFHFIGIGGIGMSGLARILLARGYRVSGSDAAETENTRSLAAAGATIVRGHGDPTLAGLADVLVTTRRAEEAAATEIGAARDAGAMIVKRGQLLGMIASERRSIAVAGSHGKSSTTGMLTAALRELGQDPTYAIGAMLTATGANAAPGEGPHMVVEADEFDHSFLFLRPDVAIITTVSFDHPDIYPTQAEYDEAFVQFARCIQPGGTLVICADNAGCQRVLTALRQRPEECPYIVTYGKDTTAHWRLTRRESGWWVIAPDGEEEALSLQVPGAHMALNATGAIAALTTFGFSLQPLAQAVSGFTGVGRRFEHKGRIAGIDVIDDYAHHPDEIRATLQAARERFPGRRVIAVFQPHTYSRTKSLLPEFAAALDRADRTVLLEIYPSGETETLGVSSQAVIDAMSRAAVLAADPGEAVSRTLALAQPEDVILTLGAGDVTTVGPALLAALGQRVAAPESDGIAVAAPKTRQRPTRRGEAGPAIPGHPLLQVTRDAAMSMYTTMRVGGPADLLVRAQTPDDLVAAARWGYEQGWPITVIGGGSNLLVNDRGIRGLTIVARIPGVGARNLIAVEDEGDAVRVSIAAQAPLSWAGRYAAEHGWAGLDWGVGLPGQIGGATVNNAGAHGTELKDYLQEIEIYHFETGETETVAADWLEPSYRMTTIKGAPRPRPWLVLRSTFRLPKAEPAALIQLADAHAEFRRRTQPTGACSGSTFANPPGDFAGRLLEAAGLRGYRLGQMQLSPKHANWVVNTGGGTAAEAWALIEYARDVVHERFGIELRPEVERVGDS
jgi:UDP-N-acetylmuramate--alanine ligase